MIEAERCTGAFLIGPTLEQVLEVNKDHRYDLKSLRTFRGKREWNEMITVDTSPWARNPGGYGQTEVTGMLTYEGHDEPQRAGGPNPKEVDQPLTTPRGSWTENGKFFRAAMDFKSGLREKLRR